MTRVITVNGTTYQFDEKMDIDALLTMLKLTDTICAVEVNSTLVSHHDRENFKLQDGDTVEIVSLVGGG